MSTFSSLFFSLILSWLFSWEPRCFIPLYFCIVLTLSFTKQWKVNAFPSTPPPHIFHTLFFPPKDMLEDLYMLNTMVSNDLRETVIVGQRFSLLTFMSSPTNLYHKFEYYYIVITSRHCSNIMNTRLTNEVKAYSIKTEDILSPWTWWQWYSSDPDLIQTKLIGSVTTVML